MKSFLIALQFLTILPIKIKSHIKQRDFGTSLIYFPLVGVLIGLLLFLTLHTFSFLPYLVKVVLVLIASIIITGAIHLDGFADTCDGFFSCSTKEKIFEIMRDSRIGTMGVIGIVCLLLFKLTIIFSIPKEVLWKALIMIPAFARWAQVLACYTSKYARKEGTARCFVEYAGGKEVFIGALFTLGLFFLLMGIKGFILFVISMLPICLSITFIKHKINGMTGDTIGAISEATEVFTFFFILILSRISWP